MDEDPVEEEDDALASADPIICKLNSSTCTGVIPIDRSMLPGAACAERVYLRPVSYAIHSHTTYMSIATKTN